MIFSKRDAGYQLVQPMLWGGKIHFIGQDILSMPVVCLHTGWILYYGCFGSSQAIPLTVYFCSLHELITIWLSSYEILNLS